MDKQESLKDFYEHLTFFKPGYIKFGVIQFEENVKRIITS